MSNTSKFDFCPKCGALARDGACQSCGYVNPESVPKQPAVPPLQEMSQQQAWQSQQTWQSQQAWQPQQTWQAQNVVPAQNSEKNNKALITILVIIVIILGLLFTCCVGSLSIYMFDLDIESMFEEETERTYPWEEDRESKESEAHSDLETPSSESAASKPSGTEEEMTKPSQDLEGLENGKYYEGLYNALREDLVYNIEFKLGEHIPEEYGERVVIQVEYPQLTGAAPNLDIINAYLEREYTYFLEYFVNNYEPYITDNSAFYCISQGFVTYMDEKVLSVVFQEEIYIDGDSMIQYYCLNFDMTDGVILNNVDIMNLDLDFAVEFRRREILENGDEWLTDFTDQEILEMLKDADHLVIFYTPMGMEVGLNLYEVVLFMTYSDYEKFLNLY